MNCGLLILATVAVLLPSLLSETHTEVVGNQSELALSRFQSVILLLCYGLYLVFQVGHLLVHSALSRVASAFPAGLVTNLSLHSTTLVTVTPWAC